MGRKRVGVGWRVGVGVGVGWRVGVGEEEEWRSEFLDTVESSLDHGNEFWVRARVCRCSQDVEDRLCSVDVACLEEAVSNKDAASGFEFGGVEKEGNLAVDKSQAERL